MAESNRAYIREMRQRLGLEPGDASRDDHIERMTPRARLRLLCGWHFGDPGWADYFIEWAKDSGYEIIATTKSVADLGTRSKFTHTVHGKIIAVVDENKGDRSVTNDAEAVIASLATKYDLSKYRVIYRDTRGIWDEMVVRDGRFLDFRSINEHDLEAALAKFREGT